MANPSSRRYFQAVLALLSVASLWFGSVAPASASTKGASKTNAAGASAKSAIIADWEAFFSGKTPVKRKIALVQDGSAFAQVIESQEKNNPLTSSTSAKVLSVTITGSNAVVRYTIDLGGKPALANQKGEAVLQAGTWKVGSQSFCALLLLEGTKAGACPAPKS